MSNSKIQIFFWSLRKGFCWPFYDLTDSVVAANGLQNCDARDVNDAVGGFQAIGKNLSQKKNVRLHHIAVNIFH